MIKHIPLFLLIPMVVMPITSSALELGALAAYSNSDKDLNVMGYELPLESGGVGLELRESFLGDRVSIGVAYQQATAGNTQAAFNGATYGGSADLTTQRFNVTYAFYPKDVVTPFLSADFVKYDAKVNFTGRSGGNAVVGTAEVDMDRLGLSAGIQYALNDSMKLSAELGQSDWDLKSFADGTSGNVRTRTTVKADDKNLFVRFGLNYAFDSAWSAHVEIADYQMDAINSVDAIEATAGIRYAF